MEFVVDICSRRFFARTAHQATRFMLEVHYRRVIKECVGWVLTLLRIAEYQRCAQVIAYAGNIASVEATLMIEGVRKRLKC